MNLRRTQRAPPTRAGKEEPQDETGGTSNGIRPMRDHPSTHTHHSSHTCLQATLPHTRPGTAMPSTSYAPFSHSLPSKLQLVLDGAAPVHSEPFRGPPPGPLMPSSLKSASSSRLLCHHLLPSSPLDDELPGGGLYLHKKLARGYRNGQKALTPSHTSPLFSPPPLLCQPRQEQC